MKEIELKKFQKEYIRYLKVLIDFFEANDIKYSLAYGTLLGAIREHDMIPWDTDIDLWLFEDEMLKIEKLSSKLPNCFYFRSYKNNEEFYGLNRVYIKNLYRIMTGEKEAKNVYIDLFVLKKVGNVSKQKKIFQRYKKLEERTSFKYSKNKPSNFIKRNLKPIFQFFAPSLKTCNKKMKRIMSNYISGDQFMICLYLGKFAYSIPKRYIETSFGSYYFSIFDNSGNICKITYGDDYMTPKNFGYDADSTFFIQN